MWDKLLQLIQNAINKMGPAETNVKMPVRQVGESLDSGISSEVNNAIELWLKLYKDEAPWLNKHDGIYSLGVAKQMCNDLARDILLEMDLQVLDSMDAEQEPAEGTKAKYLTDVFREKIVKYLNEQLEQALALGGMIIKPYVANNKLYMDFCMQGDFYPIAFNDDGVLVDVAFLDQFTEKNMRYSKVERHIFNEEQRTVTVLNSAYVSRVQKGLDMTDLGDEISLDDVARWQGIQSETTIQNVDKPLYGYYRVATANNIDLKSPLGVSLFAPAVKMIERADIQFSRLDWEYEGGQMAIDVDPTALNYEETYYGHNTIGMDRVANRLYRRLDLGKDDTYNAFAPSLRDTQYLQGLYFYLQRIEDLCGLSRGCLSPVDNTAKTATEIKLSKQKTYNTVSRNQDVLEECLRDVMTACEVYLTLYGIAQNGDAELVIEWKDSVLTDTESELNQRITLNTANIISAAEVRAWYTGEDLKTAQKAIDSIDEKNAEKALKEITQLNNDNLDYRGGEEDDRGTDNE